MNSSTILLATMYVYGLSAFLYMVSWIFRKDTAGKVATWAACAAVFGNTAGFLLRWVESYQMGMGHAPLSNLYESLIFFALTIAVIYLVVEFKFKNRMLGAFSLPLAFLSIAYASLPGISGISSEIKPLIPALKSNWLIAHVVTCFIGYAAFAIAFAISIVFLAKFRSGDKKDGFLGRFPEMDILDELTHRMIMFGFLFLTVGIITGAVWANSAWGSYWTWDPKETWSLITWFVYAIALHARVTWGVGGRGTAYISIMGFMAVLFTYFGVNMLPNSLHSYGNMKKLL